MVIARSSDAHEDTAVFGECTGVRALSEHARAFCLSFGEYDVYQKLTACCGGGGGSGGSSMSLPRFGFQRLRGKSSCHPYARGLPLILGYLFGEQARNHEARKTVPAALWRRKKRHLDKNTIFIVKRKYSCPPGGSIMYMQPPPIRGGKNSTGTKHGLCGRRFRTCTVISRHRDLYRFYSPRVGLLARGRL